MTALNRSPYAVIRASEPIVVDRDHRHILVVVDPPEDIAARMRAAREIAEAMNAAAERTRQSFSVAAE